ncbi:hypothetical protein ACTXT7_001633 [Hymenolepis weldensis]
MAAICVADFKASVGVLYTNQCTELNDKSPELTPLLRSIERVMEAGLKECPSLFGEAKQYCWNAFERLMQCSKEYKYEIPYSLSSAYYVVLTKKILFLKVNECSRVKTAVGKGRLLLRTLANNGGLGDLVKLIKENKSFIYEHYEPGKAVFTNEVQCQIFYSFIADFARIKFDLNLTHADFLDTTWDIPVYKYKDFVPCSKLGIKVRYVDSYYIVTDFEEGFVEEEKFFELGDAITSMAGTTLRGRVVDIQKIFTKECRKLLRFEIVKLATENGSFFRPIVDLIKKGNIPNILGSSESSVSRDKSWDWPALESLDFSKCYAALSPQVVDTAGLETKFPPFEVRHTLRYIGSVDMGGKSDMVHIPGAIGAVLAENPVAGRYMPVRVRLGNPYHILYNALKLILPTYQLKYDATSKMIGLLWADLSNSACEDIATAVRADSGTFLHALTGLVIDVIATLETIYALNEVEQLHIRVPSRDASNYISPNMKYVPLLWQLQPNPLKAIRVQTLDLGELDVAFWPILPNPEINTAQEEPFLKRAYPTISAVGQEKKATRYFGFIAGNSTCSMATNFTAYVFLALTPAVALQIVKGISNGFKRTNWAM